MWSLGCKFYCNVYISYSPVSAAEINAPSETLTGLRAKHAQTATSDDMQMQSFE